MKTSIINVAPTGTLGIRDIYEKNDYPKIAITAKDIYNSKKEFIDIRYDHKNAHFQMGDFRSKS